MEGASLLGPQPLRSGEEIHGRPPHRRPLRARSGGARPPSESRRAHSGQRRGPATSSDRSSSSPPTRAFQRVARGKRETDTSCPSPPFPPPGLSVSDSRFHVRNITRHKGLPRPHDSKQSGIPPISPRYIYFTTRTLIIARKARFRPLASDSPPARRWPSTPPCPPLSEYPPLSESPPSWASPLRRSWLFCCGWCSRE